MIYFEKFLRIVAFHVQCYQKITISLSFEDRAYFTHTSNNILRPSERLDRNRVQLETDLAF